MTNPKQARIARTSVEQVTPRDEIARRLRILGASDDEISSFLDGWDQLDEDWTSEARYGFVHLSDARLRQALTEVRSEFPFEEERRGELLDVDPHSVAVGVMTDTAEQLDVFELPEGAPAIDAPIVILEAWVDNDPTRAAMVIHGELLDSQLRGQTPRKTLLAKMQAIVDA